MSDTSCCYCAQDTVDNDRRAALEHAVAEAARAFVEFGYGRQRILLVERVRDLESFLAGKETSNG